MNAAASATTLNRAAGPPKWRRALLAMALVSYTLLFSELFVRLLDPQALMPRYVTGTAWGVRGNIPHAHYYHHTPEVDVEFRINAEGMRDEREFPLQKPAGVCRVAVFGDSFLVGYELKLQDTFAARLEQRLRSAGINAEVLNFSVSGFGTAEELQTFEGFGRRFDPDVVMFQWHESDPDDNVRSGLFALKRGELVRISDQYQPGVQTQDLLMKSRLYRLVADHSHLYSLVRERIAGFLKAELVNLKHSVRQELARSAVDRQPHPAQPPQNFKNPSPVKAAAASGAAGPAAAAGTIPDEDLQDIWARPDIQLSAALLARSRATVEADHRNFYVVAIPTPRSRVEIRSAADLLPPQTRSLLRIISPDAAFRRAARPDLKLYYERGHGHLTPIAVGLLVDQTMRAIGKDPHFAACPM